MNKDSTVTLHTGNKMPVMGLGTWQLMDQTADTVAFAINKGYRLIDTSSDYGSQPGIGDGIIKSGVSREELFITTKVEEMDDAYKRTLSNLEELKLEYVDLMLIHRPPPTGAGEKLWEGLIKAKNEKLVRDIGVSNYSADLIDKLIEDTEETPTVNQIEWSPFGYSNEFKAFCDARNILIQAYSPLTRTQRLDEPALQQIASKYQKSPAQILIRWNLQFGTVPIPKANHKNHIEENINVFDFEISDEDMNTLYGFNEEYSSLGSLPYV